MIFQSLPHNFLIEPSVNIWKYAFYMAQQKDRVDQKLNKLVNHVFFPKNGYPTNGGVSIQLGFKNDTNVLIQYLKKIRRSALWKCLLYCWWYTMLYYEELCWHVAHFSSSPGSLSSHPDILVYGGGGGSSMVAWLWSPRHWIESQDIAKYCKKYPPA